MAVSPAFPQDILTNFTGVKWAVADTWLYIGLRTRMATGVGRADVPSVGGGFNNSFDPDPVSTPPNEPAHLIITNHNAANFPDPIIVVDDKTPPNQRFVVQKRETLPLIGYFTPLAVDDEFRDLNGGPELDIFTGGVFGGAPAAWAAEASNVRKNMDAMWLSRFVDYQGGDAAPVDIRGIGGFLLINLKNIVFKTPLDVEAQADKFKCTIRVGIDAVSEGGGNNYEMLCLSGRKIFSNPITSVHYDVDSPNPPTNLFGAVSGGTHSLPPPNPGETAMSITCHRRTLLVEGFAFNNRDIDGKPTFSA